jgi:signal peptidase I
VLLNRHPIGPGVAPCASPRGSRPLVAALLAWLRGGLLLVTVTGWSMAPALADGDRLLVRKGPAGAVRRGDVVLLRRDAGGDPRNYVKRAVALPGEPMPAPVGAGAVPAGTVVVLGDNPGSEDSRQWGPVPAAQVVGVVIAAAPRPTYGRRTRWHTWPRPSR